MLSSIKEQSEREREGGGDGASCSSIFTPENFISAIWNWAEAMAMAEERVNYGLAMA